MTIPDRVELVRVFPVSRERVWAAITEPEQLAKWFVSAVQVEDLRVGAPIRFIKRAREDPSRKRDRLWFTVLITPGFPSSYLVLVWSSMPPQNGTGGQPGSGYDLRKQR
jgi:uncharacterized protein YndB with AHSA1/START domain